MKTYLYAALATVVVFGAAIFFLLRNGFFSGPYEGNPAVDSAESGGAMETPQDVGAAGSTTSGSPPAPAPAVTTARKGGVVAKSKEPDKKLYALKMAAGPLPRGNSGLLVITLDMSGKPFPQVPVTLLSAKGQKKEVTDEEGEADFPKIPAGTYTVRVRDRGGLELDTARQVELEDGENRELALKLGDYDASISGRIVNRDGVPVPGITVEAKHYLFRINEENLRPRDQSRQRAVSGADGSYHVANLLEGEYDIRAVATPVYASVHTIARTGVESADLILDTVSMVRVYGEVTTLEGHALDGVRVLPVGETSRATTTDKDGRYSVDFPLANRDRAYTLKFTLEGFRTHHLNLPEEEMFEETELPLDAELESLGDTAPVSGVITAADNGDRIVGETVYLHSASLNARYLAMSDEEGVFYSPAVQVRDDYRLWIHPQSDFKDFSMTPVSVSTQGLELDIELEPLGTGSLSGEMVDSEENPLPGFSLWLRSTDALGRWIRVTGDDKGRFEIDGVPAGDVLFDTRSPPRIRAQGARVEVDEETEVRLVIDWGTYELQGRATDDKGEPLTGVRVELHWTHGKEGVRSSSLRRQMTDEDGGFHFTQLGLGPHQVRAFLQGFKNHQTSYEVKKTGSGELDLELEETEE